MKRATTRIVVASIVTPILAAALAAQAVAGLTRGPYLQNVTMNSIVICCQADPAAPATLTVHPADDPAKVRTIQISEAKPRHEIPVDQLQPATAYQYRLQMGQDTATGQFRTAPPPGQPFQFAVFGDSRSNPDRAEKVAQAIAKTGVPLVLHTGDLVARGRDLSLWDPEFFRPMAALMRNAVLYPAIGNHELGGPTSAPDGRQIVADYFALPGTERYYSFDYGDVHVCVLDSTADLAPGSDQYRWAERDLLEGKAPWKVVMFHHPMYCAGSHDSNLPMRNVFGPLFARAGVDLIVTGHEHNYQRAKPIAHYLEADSPKPYVHIISGGGGAPLYTPRVDELWTEQAQKTLHFVLVSVDGPTMTAQTIDSDGQVIDRFNIDRRHPTTQPLAYERIELVRVLSAPRLTDPAGESACLVFAEPARPAQFIATWTNPTPVPVELAVELAAGPDVTVTPSAASLKLDPKGQPGAERQAGFTVSLAKAQPDYPPLQLRASIKSRFATDPAKPVTLPTGLRRTARAAQLASPVAIDGRLDEPAWQADAAMDGFYRSSTGRILPTKESPRVILGHHQGTLTIGLTVALPEGYQPRRGASVTASDHVYILVSGSNNLIKVLSDVSGRSVVPEGVTSAGRVEGGQWTFEAAIPLAPLGVEAGGGAAFNLGVFLNREWLTWSPTGGAAVSERTCGVLALP